MATLSKLSTLTLVALLTACGDNKPTVEVVPTPSNKPSIKNDAQPKRNLRRLQATELENIKPIEKKTGRFAECGVENYNLKQDSLCGVESYHLRSTSACNPIIKEDPQFGARQFNSGSGEACGVAEYISKSDEACGVDEEEFWSGWDESCPAGYAAGSWYSALANTETRVNRVSWTDIRIETRHLCKRRTPKTCSLPQFGVKQYNSCRHANFGVESYNSGVVGYEACRHESHGVESYKSCRHETFGAESYKSCSLYMTQGEFNGFLQAQHDLLPALKTTFLDTGAIYYSAAGKRHALACLVKEISEDPAQKELSEDLKLRYYTLTDKLWSADEAKECEKGFVDIDEAECAQDDLTIACTSLRSFRAARSAINTARKNLNLLSQEAKERGNQSAIDAVNGLLDAVR
ncbi:hypothetical protein EBR21_06460 [bacterium]|nr:hypothetical protein [bacterium]